MNIDTVFFKATDGVELKGIVYKSAKRTNKILISIHGMSTNCIKIRDEKIGKRVNEQGIDLLTFNNRGHDIVNYIKRDNGKSEFAGTAYEEFSECYEDILGAIDYCSKNNYNEIYLMGHSLGSTKTVYFYNRLIKENNKIAEKIKALLLLSLIDIPYVIREYLQNNYQYLITYAKNMEKEGMQNILMPENSFIYPISVKSFLRYTVKNQDINFAKYTEKEYEFNELNNITVPLFMRWGTDRELIIQKANDLCQFLKSKITNKDLDIGYISEADHSYTGKEEILADEIARFIKNVNGNN